MPTDYLPVLLVPRGTSVLWGYNRHHVILKECSSQLKSLPVVLEILRSAQNDNSRGDCMNVSDAIRLKRVVRKFQDKLLPEDVIRAILNAGRRSQSSKNEQL